MFKLNLWLYGVVMKLVPCLVLGIVTALLVFEMYKVFVSSYIYRNFVRGGAGERMSHSGNDVLLSIIF